MELSIHSFRWGLSLGSMGRTEMRGFDLDPKLRDLLRLAMAGAAMDIVMILFVCIYLVSFNSGHPFVARSSVFVMLLLVATIFRRGYLILQSAGPSILWIVILFAGGFGLIGLYLPAFGANGVFGAEDVFSYINSGWEQSHYHLNPYTQLMRSVHGWQNDPMLIPLWVNYPLDYGFLFGWITNWICQLGGGNLRLTLLLFKVANLVAWSATGALLLKLARRLKIERPDLALYLYLWNPFFTFQVIASGHNDILTVALVILAFYCIVVEFWLPVAPILTSAIMVKLIPVVIAPFALVYMVRRGGIKATLASLGASLVLLFVLAAPYVTHHFWPYLVRSLQLALYPPEYSLTEFSSGAIVRILSHIPGLHAARSTICLALGALVFAGGVLVVLIQLGRFAQEREPSPGRLVAIWVFVEFVLICVMSSVYHPWFIANVLPLALLVDRGHWLRRLCVVLSLTGLTWYALTEFVPLAFATMLGLPTLVTLCTDWRTVRSNLLGTWERPGKYHVPAENLVWTDAALESRANKNTL
jgi:hypothetical protein